MSESKRKHLRSGVGARARPVPSQRPGPGSKSSPPSGSGQTSRQGGGLVYSTRHGEMCPRCCQPVTDCRCAKGGVPNDGIVRVSRQTRGRKGKGVTLITGVPLGAAQLLALAQELKQRCGSGGTVKDGIIEIQGDHRELVAKELEQRGWKVKLAGG